MLPKAETTFHFEIVGDKTKKRYAGEFTVKALLTNREMMTVALTIDRMGGSSETLPLGYSLFIRALSELDARIVESPKFWRDSNNGRDLYDSNVVSELYGRVLDEAKKYEDTLAAEAEKSEAQAKDSDKKKKKSEPAAQ